MSVYTLTGTEYLDAQRAFKTHLSSGRLVFRMMLPVASGAALAGAYSLFIAGNLGLGIGLCLASGYLVISRMFWWQRRLRRVIEAHPERLGPFEVELTNGGIKFSPGVSEFSWPVLLRYFETRDLFILLGPERELCILPKRALPMGDRLRWTERLRGELKGKGRRDNPDALLLKVTATWALAALFAMTLFAGSIQNLFSPTFRRASARNSIRMPAVSTPPPAQAAPMSELKGLGTVYFVPLGQPQSVLSPDLLSYYHQKYGLEVHVLAPVALPAWTRDESRHQLIAEGGHTTDSYRVWVYFYTVFRVCLQ
jgi:hypothetical protein